MESRIEDLEALSAAQNANGAAGASGAPVDISSLMSPKEARHLRKLSILAGFEKKWSRSQRSSISGGANSNHSITTGYMFISIYNFFRYIIIYFDKILFLHKPAPYFIHSFGFVNVSQNPPS